MKNNIQKEKTKDYMQFPIHPEYNVEFLAQELARWLQSEYKKETEYLDRENGWLVQAREPGGTLNRLVRRKASCMHISMTREGCKLNIRMTHDKWVEKDGAGRSSSFLDTATELASAAASGIVEIWSETKTTQAVSEFIGNHIAHHFRQASGAKTTGIDASLSRYTESMTSIEKAWTASFLDYDEILLAWLKTSTRAPDSDAEWIFILTTRRQALVSFSKTRHESFKELPKATMSVTETVGRDTVTIGEIKWRTQLHNDMLFLEIAPLPDLEPEERLHETGRLNFVSPSRNDKNLQYAMAVLDYISELSHNPFNALSRICIKLVSEKEKKEANAFEKMADIPHFSALAKDLAACADPEHLSQWADFWRLNTVEQLSLGECIQSVAPDSPQLARFVRPMLAKATKKYKDEIKDKTLHILPDIRYAENLILCGQREEAVRILEHRLSDLPDESLSDLIPDKNSDLTKGQGGQVIKTRILELLVEARGVSGKGDIDTLTKLASLHPLAPDRLKKLYDAGNKDMRKRVSVPIDLLEKGGLVPRHRDEEYFSQGKARALSLSDIEEKLRHPASREGTVMKKLQNFIASKKAPDQSVLKSYAKQVNSDNHPELASAITDGSFILGMEIVEAFISSGEQNMGITAYPGSPPFILIGSIHLENGTGFAMSDSELRYIIGVELAHLRFKHERITSREIWEGAFDKTMSVIEFIPVAGTYLSKLGKYGKLVGHASEIAKKIINVQQYITQAKDVATSAQNFYYKHTDTEKPPDANKQNLLSAFREMQLTADRAALVICGDLKAAVRAVFKSCPKLNPELQVAETEGLVSFLGRTDEEGELMFQDLAIRLAALFSFYLSEDYTALRSAAISGSNPCG
ncbi:MAG: hypothetical protein GY795_15550 [Desulfobacterales bacterium]|nr:hypothetical protein [Desulfobacterales bacterium]